MKRKEDYSIMGICCGKSSKTSAVEAILVDNNEEDTEDFEHVDEISKVYLRRFCKVNQDWYCQNLNYMVAHSIKFSDDYYKTTPIWKTEDLVCSVCQKVHKIEWKFYKENGIITG